jgi:hypothetical protein
MAKSEDELLCLLRGGIKPTALVVNENFENGKFLAELMKRRSPSILVEFFSSGKALPGEDEALLKKAALQDAAKKLVKLHH